MMQDWLLQNKRKSFILNTNEYIRTDEKNETENLAKIPPRRAHIQVVISRKPLKQLAISPKMAAIKKIHSTHAFYWQFL